MFRVLQLYKSIVQGVAFIPLMVMGVLTILALFFTLSPIVSSINSFVYSGGYFEIRTSETARAVLTSILTGLVSLTVFGFSMMIVVVNQAASNYSPKVVETLMAERSNQYILGVNLGTIVFALIVMIHIDNKKADGGIPELAILVAVLLTTYCLLLFVRFINNISNSVRINNIIKFIYKTTKGSISHHQQKRSWTSEKVETSGWTSYPAGHSGYFQILRSQSILEILKKEDVVLKVIPLPGTYYLRHEPLFCTSKPLSEHVVDQLRGGFVTYHGEPITENPMYGFRQLREIAVKALSPGINDPGVAILCIEHLAELLTMECQRKEEYLITDEEKKCRIICRDYDFSALLEVSLLPIKWYGSRDMNVLSALLHAVNQISQADQHGSMRSTLSEYVISLLAVAQNCASDIPEQHMLNKRIKELLSTGYFDASVFERRVLHQDNDHTEKK